MHANRRFWLNLLALLFFVVSGGLTATLIAATTESVDKTACKTASKTAKPLPKVVSPPDRSVLLSGHLDIIYRGDEAELEVDSRPVPWEKAYDAPIHVGHLHLSPGMHRVKIGDRKVQLCVALNEMEHDGPSDWKIHRVHTMSNEKDRCAECHDVATRDTRMIVGKMLAPESCMACHTDSEVKETHDEFVQPLKSCQTCHALHGSPFRHLLKAPEAQIREKYAAAK